MLRRYVWQGVFHAEQAEPEPLCLELIYDHDRSEAEASYSTVTTSFCRLRVWMSELCLTKSCRDTSLRCESFAYNFPYCWAHGRGHDRVQTVVHVLNTGKTQLSKLSTRVSIPALAPTCPTTPERARAVGMNSVTHRIIFHQCLGELGLLEKTIHLLYHYAIELLYVYNAEFNIRVLEQRVCISTRNQSSQKTSAITQNRVSHFCKPGTGSS
ncbi:hypothetical protein DPEC_G00361560 [Dallia pectoralis]|nr:hypothetical protein DPEC_G00361560 [Dallia pectoralis]